MPKEAQDSTHAKIRLPALSGTIKVLIADDNDDIRGLLRAILTAWKFEVFEASNGVQASKVLESNPDIRIALLDWVMPVMDGLELSRSLQAEKNPPYIIMFTGKVNEEELCAMIQGAGVNDYLTKPFIPDILWWKLLAATRFLKDRECAQAIKRMKILIADDDKLYRTVLRNCLTKWEHEVLEANDGGEAIKLLEQENGIQIAILDRNMPEMNGLELCQNLQKKGAAPYVLVASGLKTDNDIREGLEAGANDYLCKPFTLDNLQSRLMAAARFLEASAKLNRQVREQIDDARPTGTV